jgi:1-acyl-sn-glycerol-3-phosphate acyltransferase
MTPYSIPIANRLLRRIFRPIFRLIFFLLSDVKITGKENIPEGKPYLITMNHISLFRRPSSPLLAYAV